MMVYFYGRGERTQTFDLSVPNRARYQLRHTPMSTYGLDRLYSVFTRISSGILMIMSSTLHQTLLQSKKVRFGAVGIVNTTIDFTVLFLMVTFFAVPVIIANVVSTSVALGVSFLLNKKTVFKDNDKGWVRQILLFAGVTLAGLWGLQSVVIVVTVATLEQSISHTWALLLAKVVATIVSLVWNYVWYSRVVFRNPPS